MIKIIKFTTDVGYVYAYTLNYYTRVLLMHLHLFDIEAVEAESSHEHQHQPTDLCGEEEKRRVGK